MLGSRYDECVQALLSLGDVAMTDVFGPVDALKLHSSLTLFAEAAPQSATIDQLLARHFGGEPDPADAAPALSRIRTGPTLTCRDPGRSRR